MFSVIIPVHNRRRNLFLTLEAIRQQSLSKDNFEVIVIDDASDDRVFDVIEEFRNSFRFKYAFIFKKDIWNASRPRNYGAKIAEKESKAFLFVDSDVVLNKDALKFYWEDFESNSERVIIGPYNWTVPQIVYPEDIVNRFEDYINNNLPKLQVDGGLGHIGDDVRKMSFDKAKSSKDTFNTVYDGLACFGGNLLIPKNIFWKAGGYDENIFHGCEDGDFGLTLWELGVNFSYDKRCIGYHAWHPLSKARALGLRTEVDKLNKKHFGTTDQKLIDYTKEAFRKWGYDTWEPPPEWITSEGQEK